eukprot:2376074-Rhodomonas_salina.1
MIKVLQGLLADSWQSRSRLDRQVDDGRARAIVSQQRKCQRRRDDIRVEIDNFIQACMLDRLLSDSGASGHIIYFKYCCVCQALEVDFSLVDGV